MACTMVMTTVSAVDYPLEKCPNNLCDKASLQRGAALYVNYCVGCHSLKYLRFDQLARDLKMVDDKGKPLEKLVVDNLNFLTDKITDTMENAIPPNDAVAWYGIPPRDLSVVVRYRGKDWLYTYLKTYYKDDTRPVGVNNLVFKDVGMPHLLLELQGEQVPLYSEGKTRIKGLTLSKPGILSVDEYDKAMIDLVNFLEYVGEPHKLTRQRMGGWVLLFLIVFTAFAYMLKREYWKDIH